MSETKEKKEKVSTETPVEDRDAILVNTETNKSEANKRAVLTIDHKCFFGSKWYSFTAGEVYTIPKNLWELLRNRGLLQII